MTRHLTICATLIAAMWVIVLASVAQASPSYVCMMAGGATSLKTNNERYEASSNPYPVVELCGGHQVARFDIGVPVRLDAEARGFWWQQRGHGHYEQNIDGSFMALGALFGPVVSLELERVELFATGGAGVAYQDLDITDDSQDGINHSKRGAVFAWRGAGGVRVPVTDGWSVRAEGFYGRAGEIEQVGGGVSLVLGFGGG